MEEPTAPCPVSHVLGPSPAIPSLCFGVLKLRWHGCRHVAFHGAVRRIYLPAPFLEGVTGVNVSALSLILLLIGASGLVGTYLIGVLLKAVVTYLVLIPPSWQSLPWASSASASSVPSVPCFFWAGGCEHACAGGLGPVVEQGPFRRMRRPAAA